MTNAILCAVDFTDSSKEALKWSVALARDLKAHLTVLHTYRLLQTQNGEAVAMKMKTETEAIKNLMALEKELLKGQDITYDLKSEIGFIADRIKEHAKKNKLRLLVIGKHVTTANIESLNEAIEEIGVPLAIVP
jgi:nucleotide-binding universal stress UspA family protein